MVVRWLHPHGILLNPTGLRMDLDFGRKNGAGESVGLVFASKKVRVSERSQIC